MSTQFLRLAETQRSTIPFHVDGHPCTGLAGDTVLTAVLTSGSCVRHSDFGGQARAGFCLMGACQDCWMWLASGQRIRACTTLLAPGMQLLTYPGTQP